jgi:hypothetical protein
MIFSIKASPEFSHGNWEWRMTERQLDVQPVKCLLEMTTNFGCD